MRTIKKHHERKKEFLEIARKLFFTHGYEQTPVEAIIKEVGLSKGSFYYYFKSKEDLLDELTKELSQQILEKVKEIVAKENWNAVRKLNEAYKETASIKLENIKLVKTLLKAFYGDKNYYFRYKVYQNSTDMLAPEFAEIIKQGLKEKVFNTPYPDEASRMFFELSFVLSEKVPKMIMEIDRFPENIEKIEKELGNYQFAIERIIGAKEGSIKIFNRALLKKFLEKLKVQYEKKE